MSLDVRLMITKPTEVYSGNITHNLGKMASKVALSNGLTLYNILWRPDECDPPLQKASDIAELLDEALGILIQKKDHLKQYNPENGWGNYYGLFELVHEYRNAARAEPNADIEVCR